MWYCDATFTALWLWLQHIQRYLWEGPQTISGENYQFLIKLEISSVCVAHAHEIKISWVNRLDIVSYKSVYSLCIMIKPATLKASSSTLLFQDVRGQSKIQATYHNNNWSPVYISEQTIVKEK